MKKFNTLFTVCAFLLSASILKSAGVVYVVPGGTGSGSAWNDAMGDVQSAINAASSGTDVWIQGGTYSVTTTISQKNGVDVYGSFAGTETSIEERPLSANGNPWDFTLPTIFDGGNQCRLMKSTSGVTTESIVDGITFINGNGADASYQNNLGGALFIGTSFAVYQRCVFRNNSTPLNGGAINMTRGIIRQCLIENNTATGASSYGGGIYTNSGDLTLFENCVIRGNYAYQGGGIRAQGTANMVSIKNSKIYDNESKDAGAGLSLTQIISEMSNCLIFNNESQTDKASSVITGGNVFNCTFVNNIGNIYFSSNTNAYQFTNNIVWGNEISTGASTVISGGSTNANLQFYNNATGLTQATIDGFSWQKADNIYLASYSDVHFKGNVQFKGLAENEDQAYELESIDLSILQTSPCFNTGKIIAGVTSDIIGVSRPQGTAYDIGAYEFPLGPGTFVVNQSETQSFRYMIENSGIKIIRDIAEDEISIYAINGSRIFNSQMKNLEIYVPLTKGMYLVKVGNKVKKIVL